MNCDEAFKRLYDLLNSGTDDITPDQMDKHLNLCKTCCEYCRFNQEVAQAMQNSRLAKKASPELRNRILKNLMLP